jgi:aryl-alcohol dehydrogenase-like predicted oxidoreductase
MARAEGLALTPWDVLGGGKIRSDAEEARRRETGEKGRTTTTPNWERTEEERKVCLVLEGVAKEVNVESITSGVLALCGERELW